MKRKVLWALVGLNVLLLAGLFTSHLRDNAAHAQAGARPIDFVMIPADFGISPGVVCIIDTTTGQLGALAYSDANKQLDVMPPLDLTRALQGAAGAGNTGGSNRNRPRNP